MMTRSLFLLAFVAGTLHAQQTRAMSSSAVLDEWPLAQLRVVVVGQIPPKEMPGATDDPSSPAAHEIPIATAPDSLRRVFRQNVVELLAANHVPSIARTAADSARMGMLLFSIVGFDHHGDITLVARSYLRRLDQPNERPDTLMGAEWQTQHIVWTSAVSFLTVGRHEPLADGIRRALAAGVNAFVADYRAATKGPSGRSRTDQSPPASRPRRF